jgi:hypothetical protein
MNSWLRFFLEIMVIVLLALFRPEWLIWLDKKGKEYSVEISGKWVLLVLVLFLFLLIAGILD